MPVTATERDALRTLIVDARTNPSAPRLPTLRERRNAARTLAQEHGARVQAWMLWPGWTHAIGCETCRELGPAAACWGASAVMVSCPVAAALSAEEEDNMPPNASEQMQTVAQVEFYWPGL